MISRSILALTTKMANLTNTFISYIQHIKNNRFNKQNISFSGTATTFFRFCLIRIGLSPCASPSSLVEIYLPAQGCWNMFFRNAKQSISCHSKVLSNLFPFPMQLNTKHQYLRMMLLQYFGVGMLIPLCIGTSGLTIMHSVHLRASIQMCWITARSRLAAMINLQTIWDRAIGQHICYNMCTKIFPLKSRSTIPAITTALFPWPALCWVFCSSDFGPKIFRTIIRFPTCLSKTFHRAIAYSSLYAILVDKKDRFTMNACYRDLGLRSSFGSHALPPQQTMKGYQASTRLRLAKLASTDQVLPGAMSIANCTV